MDEAQTRYRNLVARRRHDVIDVELPAFLATLRKFHTHPVALGTNGCERCAEMHGQPPDDLVAHEPARRGTKMTRNDPKTQRFRHRMKYHRDVCTHARAPACSETRARSFQLVNQGPRLNGRIVELNGV